MTSIGIAHCAFAEQLVRTERGLVDYVEVPFEQLMHNPGTADIFNYTPVILHCASLSVAGNDRPSSQIVEQVAYWATKTSTPWIGEHLSYVRADGIWKELAEHQALIADPEYISGPFNVGYTVSPQYSLPVLERVIERWSEYTSLFGRTILLENGPSYFSMPGSTMSQGDFITALCARAPDVRLLLDLAHLAITAENTGSDPMSLLHRYPLERVVEVHLSGTSREEDTTWDDHASRTPEIVFSLLDSMLKSVRPLAITLEYNWDAGFPPEFLREDIRRVRASLSQA